MPRIKIGTHMEGIVSLDTNNVGNPHIAITGKTGFGKSIAGQTLLRNYMKQGDCTAVVFDIHRCFETSDKFANLKSDLQSMINEVEVYKNGIQLPLLTPMRFSDGEREDRLDVISAVVDILGEGMRLGCRQKGILYDAVEFMADRGSYSLEGIVALDKAFTALGDERAAGIQDKLRYILKRNLFRDGEVFLKNGMINVLRLSQLPVSAQILTREIMLRYFWRMANAGAFIKLPLWLFLDECQGLNWGKTGVIRTILSEGRKLGLKLILITPSLGDNGRSEMAQSFFQAGTKLHFSPADNEVAFIAKKLSVNRAAYWTMVLKSLDVGSCIVDGPLLLEDTPCPGALKVQI